MQVLCVPHLWHSPEPPGTTDSPLAEPPEGSVAGPEFCVGGPGTLGWTFLCCGSPDGKGGPGEIRGEKDLSPQEPRLVATVNTLLIYILYI